MKQYNCKNCGAPIKHSYNHKCEYCGTIIDFNEPKENTIEVKAEELYDLQLREVEMSPIKFDLLIYFTGYKLEKPKIYESYKNDICVSKVENYINPPKCGFVIELPIIDIDKYGMDYIIHILRQKNINEDEIEKVLFQLKNNDMFRRYWRGWY